MVAHLVNHLSDRTRITAMSFRPNRTRGGAADASGSALRRPGYRRRGAL